MRLARWLAGAVMAATAMVEATEPGISRKLVPVPLKLEETQIFLDCVAAIPERHYYISVQSSWIVVIPAEDRALDVEGYDKALSECVRESASVLMVQMGSTQYGHDEYTNAMSIFEVEFHNLFDAGAKSLQLEALNPNQGTRLSKRAPARDEYYCTYPSEYPGCRDVDLRTHQYAQCYSRPQAYQSILAANASPNRMMYFEVWPYRNCANKNSRITVLPTNSLSSCLEDRAIYSHSAYLVDQVKSGGGPRRQKADKSAEQKARSREAEKRRKSYKGRARSPGSTSANYCALLRALRQCLSRPRSSRSSSRNFKTSHLPRPFP